MIAHLLDRFLRLHEAHSFPAQRHLRKLVVGHNHRTAGSAKPAVRDIHIGLTDPDHAALATVPANFTSVAGLCEGVLQH